MFRTRQKRIVALFLCFLLVAAIVAVPVSAADSWTESWLLDPYGTAVWDLPVWKIFNHSFPLKSILDYGQNVIELAQGIFSSNPYLSLESSTNLVLKILQNNMEYDGAPTYFASTITGLDLPAQAYVVVDYDALSAISATMLAAGLDVSFGTRVFNVPNLGSTSFWCISVVPSSSSPFYAEVGSTLCFLSNSAGKILVARSSPKDRDDYQSGNVTNNTHIYNEGDTYNTTDIHYAGDTIYNETNNSYETINNNQVYDYSTNQWVEVGDVFYDYGTQTYTTNTYNSSTTNNTSYQYNYYIDYTSVTYIGSSEEFTVYEVYYQLPDGRSSADLTAEDLEQISLSYDVINYGVSADDGRLRYLNHFDGAIEDVSYWSNYTSWDWVTGPSITYMETANFGGALYLDEGAHQFTITLSSNLAAQDFSIFFRYYHSANESTTPVNELQILADSTALITVTTGNQTTLSNVPVGQWTEVGLIRDGSIVYQYVNGVVVGTFSTSAVFTNLLTFNFLAAQTYRQFDELRVYDYAVHELGDDYTPVSVPVDTNAVLILPDEAFPVPDPYWEFDTSVNILEHYDFTTGSDIPTRMVWSSIDKSFYDSYVFLMGLYCDLTVQSNCISLSSDYNVTNPTFFKFRDNESLSIEYYYLGIPLGYNTGSGKYLPLQGYGVDSTTYTFSIFLLDGSSYSLTFDWPLQNTLLPSIPTLNSSQYKLDTDVVDIGISGYKDSSSSDYDTEFYTISIVPRQQLDIVYMELVEGDTPTTPKYITEIYNSLDLIKPTIAVRSQIPVRSYRIGSVRPTLPYRGDVWMMVEHSRITSVQIYTGYMWQEVDGRIWTGSKWSSLTYFDIKTQQDFGDIIGTTDNIYIQSSTGFYEFMVTQIREILEALNTIIDKIGNITGSSTDVDLDFTLDGIDIQIGEISYSAQGGIWTIFDVTYDLIWYNFPTSGIFGTVPDIGSILTDFGNAFGFGGSGILSDDDEESFTVGSIFEGSVW